MPVLWWVVTTTLNFIQGGSFGSASRTDTLAAMVPAIHCRSRSNALRLPGRWPGGGCPEPDAPASDRRLIAKASSPPAAAQATLSRELVAPEGAGAALQIDPQRRQQLQRFAAEVGVEFLAEDLAANVTVAAGASPARAVERPSQLVIDRRHALPAGEVDRVLDLIGQSLGPARRGGTASTPASGEGRSSSRQCGTMLTEPGVGVADHPGRRGKTFA